MRQVEFTKDMRPHNAGDTRVVPNDVADRLIADGFAKPVASVYDARPRVPATPPPTAAPGKTYQTRGRRR